MADKPRRIQRSRKKGWKMPENTISVCRPGPFGNPFIVSPTVRPGARSGCEYTCVPTVDEAVACFREMLAHCPDLIARIKAELRGHNLACFCKLGEPCHADVLLEIANADAR